jgi:predicted DNA-binding transcriptional regulator YafY
MSKRGYISRYLLILKKLKVNPYSSYEALKAYMENQFEYLQMQDDHLQIGFSKRTLQRDLKEIRNVFGIDIEYSKPNKGYFIIQNENENMNFQRMMEAFDMFNSLNLAQDLTPYIHLEKRKPQGTENLYGLLHAIKNKLKIKYTYHKFWDEEFSQRLVEPLALKEFKNRWYIIANDDKDNEIKTFALDRISELEITSQRFAYPKDYNIEDKFKYSFGIMGATEEEPQEIVLSFEPFHGKYIKSLPLHHTQEILKDTENELKIKLKLFITQDFIMELLSYAENIKVIKPKSLINQIKEAHKNAYKQY